MNLVAAIAMSILSGKSRTSVKYLPQFSQPFFPEFKSLTVTKAIRQSPSREVSSMYHARTKQVDFVAKDALYQSTRSRTQTPTTTLIV